MPEVEGVPAEEDLDEAEAIDHLDDDPDEQRNLTDPDPETGNPDAPKHDEA